MPGPNSAKVGTGFAPEFGPKSEKEARFLHANRFALRLKTRLP
jgi:hypothetical protein